MTKISIKYFQSFKKPNESKEAGVGLVWDDKKTTMQVPLHRRDDNHEVGRDAGDAAEEVGGQVQQVHLGELTRRKDLDHEGRLETQGERGGSERDPGKGQPERRRSHHKGEKTLTLCRAEVLSIGFRELNPEPFTSLVLFSYLSIPKCIHY